MPLTIAGKNNNHKTESVFIQIIFSVILILTGCGLSESENSTTTKGEIEKGAKLARAYCANCHKFPEPDLLDKITWRRNVLPAMGKRLGIDEWKGLTTIKSGAIVTGVDWTLIKKYYLTRAPEALKRPTYPARPLKDWAIFKVKTSDIGSVSAPALTTLLAFNPFDGKIYSADAENNLFSWDKRIRGHLVSKLPSPATSILFSKDRSGNVQAVISCIGSLIPANEAKGQIICYNLKKNKAISDFIIADSLPRSVNIVAADFNRDGLTDYVVCCFGHDNGSLFCLRQLPSHKFYKEMIRNISGAIQAEITDINHDGWPDIICLFAQADEGIWAFINDHHGGFGAKNILKFPPVYGSDSFQLIDIDHDGDEDIIYTAGDNGDYSPILKPYHGVYIFINNGDFKFTKRYFYPINGCSRAVGGDFDHDGDVDIAAIAFFPDFKQHPSEGMVYLEQTKPFCFKPHELPIDSLGRWLVMDVKDYNGDGLADIALGNFSVNMWGRNSNKKLHAKYPFIILENQGLKK